MTSLPSLYGRRSSESRNDLISITASWHVSHHHWCIWSVARTIRGASKTGARYGGMAWVVACLMVVILSLTILQYHNLKVSAMEVWIRNAGEQWLLWSERGKHFNTKMISLTAQLGVWQSSLSVNLSLMMIYKLYHCMLHMNISTAQHTFFLKVAQRPKKQLCGVYRKVTRVEVCQQVVQRPKKKLCGVYRKVM